jgi:D-alanyl-D-alanine carboxypeptidase
MNAAITNARDDVMHDVLEILGHLGENATGCFPMPGGVIGFSDLRGSLGEVAFGYANLEQRVRMDVGFRFEIGSISKLFTALAINRLVEQGRLDLSEPVASIVTWADLADGDQPLTVGQLLTHTSGLVSGADALPDDAGEIWNSRGSRRASTTPPRFHYSNYGYLLLGEVVRARSGRRLNELVRDEWLEPFGMRDALAEVTLDDYSSFATGYWPARPDRPWVAGEALAPAQFFETDSASGNVAATIGDMNRLMMALVGASSAQPLLDSKGAPTLSSEMFERITSVKASTGEPVYVVAGTGSVEESRYAMGINVERINGHFCVSHGGGMVGYSTFMLVDCSAGVGVTVLTNANGDTLASHLLARAALYELTERLEGRVPEVAKRWSGQTLTRSPAVSGVEEGVGTFTSDSSALTLVVESDGVDQALRVSAGDTTAALHLLASGRYVSDHPSLRRYHLDWHHDADLEGWTYGDQTFVASALDRPVAMPTPLAHPLVGRYRCFSPWFPEFRVYERAGRLWLSSPSGVESPGEEVELVALSDHEYRLGADPWLPERLILGPLRDGEVVGVERDGCAYSRVFTS